MKMLTSLTFLLTVCALAAPASAQCTRKAKFTTSDINDKYGRGLSVGRDFVAASAPNDSSGLPQAGKLFIYKDIGGTWQLEQAIQPPTLQALDLFGFSVAAGTGIVAASALFDDTQGVDSGAVYVFRRDPLGWVLEQKLTYPTPGDQLNYGRSVALAGSVLAVAKWTAPAEVLVYRRAGTTWNLEATLTPSYPALRYGTDVAVSGDMILVGDPDFGTQGGAAELYRFTPGVGWVSEFLTFGAIGSRLGESVDINGDRMVLGTPQTILGTSGQAQVFRRTAGVWALEQVLVGNDSAPGDGFGVTVSITPHGILAGAPGHDAVATNAGAVYGFTFNGTQWIQSTKRAPSSLLAFDNFGTSLDATGILMSVANRFQVQAPPDPRGVFVFEGCP